MLVTDLLTWITQGCLLLIAGSTFVDFLRHRDQARLDIALMFGALASIILFQGIVRTTLVRAGLADIGSLLLFAQPYLLLRLVQHFRPVPQPVQLVALGGMAGSWAIVIALPTPMPVLLSLLIIAYFVYVECYAALAFVHGAQRTSGVTQRRLLFAAAGSGMLALLLLLAGVNAMFHIGAIIASTFGQVVGMLSVLSYYVGFTPPRWLRQAWHLSELQRFLREMAGRSANERATTTLDHLCRAGVRAVGGIAAVVVLWDETEQHLTIRASSSPILSGALTGSGVLERAWREQHSTIARTPADFGVADAALAASVEAGALLAVPLVTVERAWGLLVVFHRRAPLFATDDLQLLALLTEQSASTLSYAALLSEQQHLVAQLQQRSAQLEAANKELEAFSYSVSHDLRAPLRSIDGFSLALLEDYGQVLDPAGHDYLQRVRVAAQRMAQLIDALLSLAQVTRSALQQQPVDLSALAHTIAADLQQAQPERQVAFVIAPGLIAHADARLLLVVLENLLGNAWKFTLKRPGATIEFGTRPHDGQLAYFVRDDGAGFDMAYAGKLFGAFQRLHPTTEFAGTGIGLATVQRIIQRHGGRVWAEGAVAHGATFYFTL